MLDILSKKSIPEFRLLLGKTRSCNHVLFISGAGTAVAIALASCQFLAGQHEGRVDECTKLADSRGICQGSVVPVH